MSPIGWANEQIANAGSTQFTGALEGTTGSAIVDLTTPGPVISVVIGPSGIGLAFLSFEPYSSTTNANPQMWCTVTDSLGNYHIPVEPLEYKGSDPDFSTSSSTVIFTGLPAGTATFKVQYANGGGAGTANFRYRRLGVVAL